MSTQPIRAVVASSLDTTQPRLLLAEDDDEIRLALAELFAQEGFEVTSVADGELLIERLDRGRRMQRMPDIIVTDHRMPGYSGTEILEGLEEAGVHIPVIVITAYGGEVATLAQELGACAVFQKPFELEDLRQSVLYWTDWSVRRLRLPD